MFCVFLVSAVLIVIGMHFTPETDIKGYWYVNPITRLPDFLAGMLLFQLYDRLKGKNITAYQGSITYYYFEKPMNKRIKTLLNK